MGCRPAKHRPVKHQNMGVACADHGTRAWTDPQTGPEAECAFVRSGQPVSRSNEKADCRSKKHEDRSRAAQRICTNIRIDAPEQPLIDHVAGSRPNPPEVRPEPQRPADGGATSNPAGRARRRSLNLARTRAGPRTSGRHLLPSKRGPVERHTPGHPKTTGRVMILP